MSVEKVKKPLVRFKGFSEEWEEKKLGELANIKTGSSDLKDAVENGKYPFFVRSEKIERSNRYLLDDEAILIPGDGKLGEIYHYINGKFDFHQRVYCINNFSKSDVKYILYYMQRKFKPYALKFTVKATVDSLRLPILTEFKIKIPSIQEQIKIGLLFKHLDNIITQKQKKLELLKQLKKTLLIKLFPTNNNKIPLIRFKGFKDEWEERKLKDIGEIQTGNTPPTKDIANYDDFGMLWVTPTDINTLTILNTVKKLSNKGIKKARIAKKGSILVTCIASIGKNAITTVDTAFNQQINSLTPTNKYNSYFLLTQSEKWSAQMINIASSGTMQIVNKTEFSNLITFTPTLQEQTQIGTFFKLIDNIITNYAKELELLKTMKKSLLKVMFI